MRILKTVLLLGAAIVGTAPALAQDNRPVAQSSDPRVDQLEQQLRDVQQQHPRRRPTGKGNWVPRSRI